MGNKGSSRKNGLSKETIDFLVKNTKFSREMIKVFNIIISQTFSFRLIKFWAWPFLLLLKQEWYTGFKIDCPSGQLTPDKFIAMYSQVFTFHSIQIGWIGSSCSPNGRVFTLKKYFHPRYFHEAMRSNLARTHSERLTRTTGLKSTTTIIFTKIICGRWPSPSPILWSWPSPSPLASPSP